MFKSKIPFFTFILCLLFTVSAFSQIVQNDDSFNQTDVNIPILFGTLQGVEKTPTGSLLYYGDIVYGQGINISTGLAKANSTTGAIDPSFSFSPGVGGGRINDVEELPNGKILIAGTFQTVSGVSRKGIARLNSDGSLDLNFDPGTGIENTQWQAAINKFLVLPSGEIIAVGSFTSFNGITKGSIVKLTNDGSVVASYAPNAGAVSQGGPALLFDVIAKGTGGGQVVIVGGFSSYDGNTRQNIVGLDVNGIDDVTFNVGIGSGAVIYDIEIDAAGRYYLGGDIFSWNGTIIDKRIIRLDDNGNFDPTFTTPAGSFGFIGAANPRVSSIVIQNIPEVKVTIAGTFNDDINSPFSHHLARINEDGSPDFTFTPPRFALLNPSEALTIYPIDNSFCVVAGSFFIPNSALINDVLTKTPVKLQSNGLIDEDFTPFTGNQNNEIDAAEYGQGKYWLAGNFGNINQRKARSACKLNNDGSTDTSFFAFRGIDSIGIVKINSILPVPNGVWLGGKFSINGFNNLVLLNLDGSVNETISTSIQVNDSVYSLKQDSQGRIIAAGAFTEFNSQPIGRILRLLPEGVPDPTFLSGSGLNSSVNQIAINQNSEIYISGSFTEFNGQPVNRLIRLASNGILDNAFSLSSNPDGGILSLNCDNNSRLMVGGDFENFNSTYTGSLTRLLADGTIDNSFQPPVPFFSPVTKIHFDSTNIIVTGGFFNLSSDACLYFMLMSENGSLIGCMEIGEATDNLIVTSCYDSLNKKVLIAGDFNYLGNIVRNGIARINIPSSITADADLPILTQNHLIYPNPSNGLIHITSNDVIEFIYIYNNIGQLMYVNENVNTSTNQLALDLEKGLYLYEIGNKKLVTHGKLIINKD